MSTPVYDPRPMVWIANIAYFFGALVYLPILLFQIVRQGKNRRGWRERLRGPRRLHPSATRRKRVWVHGVSLGEINAAQGLVCELEAKDPAYEVVISTTTDTGYARACALFGEDRVFRFPLDFSWSIRRALLAVDPVLIVLMELEVWPNLVSIASRAGVPICVANGRLTERSCHRFRWLGGLGRNMFRSLSWVGVQDEATAGRFVEVGVPADRIDVVGSVKWDTALVADRIDGQDELGAALGIHPDRPLWVCGSTGPGEEPLLLKAYDRLRTRFTDLQLVLVPRKPERFDEVASLIERAGGTCVRRSRYRDGAQPAATDGPAVVLGDTMGELRKFYALATVVFVGRSLVPMGGSDPMEVAGLGKPTVVGPHMQNFALPTSVLAMAGALWQCDSAEGVTERVAGLLDDAESARRAGAAGQNAVRNHRGATERTCTRLLTLLR